MPASGSSRSRLALRRLRANGIELHYLECGRGEPLVLVHGGSGDYQSWQNQLASFARQFRVISYSRRYSYPNRNRRITAGHSVYAEADDLAALIDKLTEGSAHLVGHSYGALTALVAALERPGLARRLVLAEPPLHGWVRDLPGGAVLLEQMAASVWVPAQCAFEQGKAADGLRIFTDGICGQGYFDGLPPAERARRLRNARTVQTLMQFRGSAPMLIREKMRGIAVPTLVVEGQHTVRVHRIADDELLRFIPGAQRAVIPAATHWTPRDNPRAFNRAVLSFLTRRPTRANRAPKPVPSRPGSRSRSPHRPCRPAPGR